jgi:FkbH-like protein
MNDATVGTVAPAKCVVWDLDDTLWTGTLLEDPEVTLQPEVVTIVETLDRRGILQSIASRNDHDPAWQQVEAFGLAEYFLVPQINWGTKSDSVRSIAEALNIATDTVIFIDDRPVERAEVGAALPDVECLDGASPEALLDHPRLIRTHVTDEARQRRAMYRESAQRQQAEERFDGQRRSFLASLDMHLVIAPAREDDLDRAHELVLRTNQLNATGAVYSVDELRSFIASPDHRLLLCRLEDRFGSHGTVGLALVEVTDTTWNLRLFLMSCRVLPYGVGAVFLAEIQRLARDRDRPLLVDFRPAERNRPMHITLTFAGFTKASEDEDGTWRLVNDAPAIPDPPDYLQLEVLD